MIKIQGKNGKKIIKKEIEIEYIDFNISESGKCIKENVCAYKLKALSLDNNIEALNFIEPNGNKLEFFIEKINTLSKRNRTVYISAFCPDLFIPDDKKDLSKRINKVNIKISPILIVFEDQKTIIKFQKFLFPRFWHKYMKIIWLKNNNYPIHSNKATKTSTSYEVTYINNMVIFKYYISKTYRNYAYITKLNI
ncbi:hypothetical protein CDFC105_71295 [Clostridioides difficile]|nr:hypothetical protein CDFC105_64364 [Clostridioides difficile]CZS03728.1 hypothetical protein CDFC105_71295 [Clostridioides difficile]